MGSLDVAILLIIGSSALILMRIFYVIHRSKPPYSRSPWPLHTLIVLGSGGHTAEMLNLLAVVQMDNFKPRYCIAAATDNMSLQKARVLGDSIMDKGKYVWLLCAYDTLTLVELDSTCNGPGTWIPLCVIAFFFKVFGIRWSSMFYVESIARVGRLSLGGLLLYRLRMADQFLFNGHS